jgi:hypothetical protein
MNVGRFFLFLLKHCSDWKGETKCLAAEFEELLAVHRKNIHDIEIHGM